MLNYQRVYWTIPTKVWNITMFIGKTHYTCQFFNRLSHVKLPEGILNKSNISMKKITILIGKTHYKRPFFNSYVKLPEGTYHYKPYIHGLWYYWPYIHHISTIHPALDWLILILHWLQGIGPSLFRPTGKMLLSIRPSQVGPHRLRIRPYAIMLYILSYCMVHNII